MKLIYLTYVMILSVLLVCSSCNKEEKKIVTGANSPLTLRWIKAYDNETKDKVETGLKWALLFLGAKLDAGSFNKAVNWISNDKLTINPEPLGFSDGGLKALIKLFSVIKQSGEYKQTGGIDIGRFIMLTLNSSNSYYAITDAPKSFADFSSRILTDTKSAGLTESNIAKGHRLINVPPDGNSDILKGGFISSEGKGSIADGSFKVTEHEVFDFMPNGMLRFMLYNESGKLIPEGDTSLGGAGKPAKCLWCHEIVIQPPFTAKTSVNNYYSPKEFESIVKKQTELLNAYRKSIKQDISYNDTQDHTFAELLYISFMEPSAERLALEWGITAEQVKEKLKGLPTHTHPEFPYLGTIYDRNDVDKFAPYDYLRVPESAREPSQYEPDLIK